MDSLIQRINSFANKSDGRNLYLALESIILALNTQATATAGLVISATTTKAKIGATAFHAIVQGILVTLAAATDMPALAGTVTNAKFNVFVFTIDSAGTTYVQMGTEGATLATIKWPEITPKRAIIGYVTINPTGTGNFVGGTTALGDVTVVPNAKYISPVGAILPNAKLGV